MKLLELIEKLGEIRLDLEDAGVKVEDIEVLVGIQPTYPLTGKVLNVATGEEVADYSESDISDEHKQAVWLATDTVGGYSGVNPYAPRALWEVQS